MAKSVKEDRQHQLATSFQIDPTAVYTFKMITEKQGSVIVAKENEIIDDVTERKRKIKYNPDYPQSPFLNDQIEAGLDPNDSPNSDPIVFREGFLQVQGYDEALVRYLLAHDLNVARKKQLNGRDKTAVFELVDYKALAQKALSSEEQKLDAKLLVRQKFVEDFKAIEYFMVSRFGIKKEDEDSFKNLVYAKAEDYPQLFLEDLNNTKHKIKYDIIEAVETGLLKVNAKGEVTWSTGTIVGVFEKGDDGKVYDSMAVWASTAQKGVKEFKELLEHNLSK